MTLAALHGQPRAQTTLTRALEVGALHHAYLFTGLEGVGKEEAARGLAQALLCMDAPRTGCGTCSACIRVAKNAHPDVLWLMPEEEQLRRGMAGRSDFAGTPSRDIRVEQVRQLTERLTFRALEGPTKVAIILDADRMNPQAQNALLKTLEEPPAETVIILIATAADALLATLRSRCAKVPFGPLSEELVAAEVSKASKLDPASARLAAVLSGGSLKTALSFDRELLGARESVIRAFEAVRGQPSALLQFAELFGGSRQEAEEALTILSTWVRDVALVQVGNPEIANRDLTALAEEVARARPAIELHRRHQLIEDAKRRIAQRNGSPRLQLEGMLIEMEGLA